MLTSEDTAANKISAIIEEALSPVNSRSVLAHAMEGSADARTPESIRWAQIDEAFLKRIESGLKLFGVASLRRTSILNQVREAALSQSEGDQSPLTVRVTIESESSVVVARNSIRQLAKTIGFAQTDRVKIATIVSELARNIQSYCSVGEVIGTNLVSGKKGIEIIARDEGKGIDDIDHVLSGNYQSPSGMGLGLLGCKRLSDKFRVQTSPKGTHVQVVKYLR